jgi:hypothetical protein
MHDLLHDQRPMCFSRMHPCLDVDHLFLLMLNRKLFFLGHSQLINIQAANTLPNNFLPIHQRVCMDVKILLSEFVTVFKLRPINFKVRHICLIFVSAFEEFPLESVHLFVFDTLSFDCEMLDFILG